MQEFVPTPKGTPNRRRAPTSRGRNGSQKVYASENDLPTYKPNNIASPSTPQKHGSGRSAAPQIQSTNQKQKNKGNRSRNAKNDVVSPGRRPDGESPSFQSKRAPVNIFAGSTFHASPAPSALPLPSFLGLSNADSPAVKDRTPELARDSTPPQTDSDEGSQVDEPTPRHSDSPLEFFFRADRAEKAERARVRRASSANTDSVSTASSVPLQDSPRKECNTFPKTIAHRSLRRSGIIENDPSVGIPSSELDGDSGLPVGPAFSTPYSERIRAARSNSAHTTPTLHRNMDPASSEALKRYLFTGQLTPSRSEELPAKPGLSQTTPQPVQQQYRPGASQYQGTYQASERLPFPNQSLPRGAPANHALHAQPPSSLHIHAQPSPPPDHLLTLEGNLRQILKLDALS
ncbi:hypothetical protein F5B22DRAFT_154968 [Xylaria bambusicola]|uniref:uncharacterized protein n=1 Tax=Xylaria bambusicola TaxID=326684 RepID=UPI00200741AB|nr:uncharacterized protein F5B22DRAFT_154968 [Xylaria bambusicola]KAI0526362.1 hypothetical protein F5B22DRAFT_154968 [Xylaria bambusicola]